MTIEKLAYQVTQRPIAEVKQFLADLNLDCIKFKLMDSDEGEGWTRENAERVEKLYKRFLFLSITTGHAIIPTKEIDAFWHQHILDTHKYAEDCEQIFGFFLHHFPYIGMRGEEDARLLERLFQGTQALYEVTFGETYGADFKDCENCGNCTSSCGVGTSRAGDQQLRPSLPALA